MFYSKAVILSVRFLSFRRQFWNQTLTCCRVSPVSSASWSISSLVTYLDSWYLLRSWAVLSAGYLCLCTPWRWPCCRLLHSGGVKADLAAWMVCSLSFKMMSLKNCGDADGRNEGELIGDIDGDDVTECRRKLSLWRFCDAKTSRW